jgi:hypothetical protein
MPGFPHKDPGSAIGIPQTHTLQMTVKISFKWDFGENMTRHCFVKIGDRGYACLYVRRGEEEADEL